MEVNKLLIPMLMQPGYKAVGWLGIIKGTTLQIDFSQLPFDQAFNLLVREIETIRTNLGADKNERTNSKREREKGPFLHIISSREWTHLDDDASIVDTFSQRAWMECRWCDWLAVSAKARRVRSISLLSRNHRRCCFPHFSFQQAFERFTGETLRQLYKIKFDVTRQVPCSAMHHCSFSS